MVITKIEGTCSFDGCKEPATYIACGRKMYGAEQGHPEPGCYCKVHAEVVAYERYPEYIDDCPNCHCRFGVN